MMGSKYKVLKTEDWEWLKGQLEPLLADDSVPVSALPNPLDDAVVIRTQDAFAHSGLVAYAANIQTYLELERSDSEEQRATLYEVANYFYDRSEEARKKLLVGEAKLPD